jgi:hypothetical protein
MHFSHIRIGTSPPTLKLRLYAGSYLCPLSDVRRSREDYIGTPVKSGDFGGKSFLVKKSKKTQSLHTTIGLSPHLLGPQNFSHKNEKIVSTDFVAKHTN